MWAIAHPEDPNPLDHRIHPQALSDILQNKFQHQKKERNHNDRSLTEMTLTVRDQRLKVNHLSKEI